MLIRLALRHMSRHWRMNLALLLGMMLCAALLAGLPMYAATIAGRSLARSLEAAYAPVRNFSLHSGGSDKALEDAFREEVQPALGDLVQEQVRVREAVVDVDRAIYRGGERRQLGEVLFVRLWSFEPLLDHVELLDGRLPDPAFPSDGVGSVADGGTRILEALVGARAAAYLDLALGDELVVDDRPGMQRSGIEGPYRLHIVGVVTPIDPESDVWWGDPTLLPFNVERQGGGDLDNLYLSLIVPPETISTEVPQHLLYWRLLLNWAAIPGQDVAAFSDLLLHLLSTLSARGVRAETGLTELLARYETQLAVGRISLVLLALQSLIAVFYVLSTLGSFVVDQSRVELAMMAGRGFGVWRLTGIWLVQTGLLAILAFLTGPVLAWVVWIRRSVPSIQPGATLTMPVASWWLAGAAIVFAWLALMIPIHRAARRNLMDWQRWRVRPPQQLRWQRLMVDVLGLALGGLAYWQLRDTGSLMHGANKAGGIAADPVLLLGPTLLLLAAGLLFSRLLPVLLHLLAWVARGTRGLVLPLSLTRLARRPAGLQRTALLISLTSSLVLFAVVFQASVLRRQQEVAQYVAGADLRVALPLDAERAAADSDRLVRLEGVRAAAAVYRSQARWSPFGTSTANTRPVNLIAVAVPDLARVTFFPPGVGGHSMRDLMAALEVCNPGSDGCGESASPVVPAVFSPDAAPGNLEVGNQLTYHVGSQPCTFEVRGIVSDWPTMERPFAIANLAALESQVDVEQAGYSASGWRELWLDVAPERHAQLVDEIASQEIDLSDAAMFRTGRIAGDAGAQLGAFQADLIAQIALSAFRLNALVLVAVSAASLVLIQVFETQGREYEFGVLRAIGLDPSGLSGMLALEGVLNLLVGLSVGSAIGCGLAYAMRPFLSLTLASSLGGYAVDHLHFAWGAIGRSYAALTGVYVVALAILLWSLARQRVYRTLRMGDE